MISRHPPGKTGSFFFSFKSSQGHLMQPRRLVLIQPPPFTSFESSSKWCHFLFWFDLAAKIYLGVRENAQRFMLCLWKLLVCSLVPNDLPNITDYGKSLLKINLTMISLIGNLGAKISTECLTSIIIENNYCYFFLKRVYTHQSWHSNYWYSVGSEKKKGLSFLAGWSRGKLW